MGFKFAWPNAMSFKLTTVTNEFSWRLCYNNIRTVSKNLPVIVDMLALTLDLIFTSLTSAWSSTL